MAAARTRRIGILPGRQEHGEETKDGIRRQGWCRAFAAWRPARQSAPGTTAYTRPRATGSSRDAGRVAEKSRRQVACLREGLRLTWVFTTEHPANKRRRFRLSTASVGWIDFPAAFHNGALSLSFNHAENHKWVEPTTLQNGDSMNWRSLNRGKKAANRDILWMAERTSARD